MKPRLAEPESHDPPSSPPASTPARRRGSGARRDRTTFVGREAEIAAIRRLVEDGAALVTLVGPPGIGKTRLSVQAARALGGDVTFCDASEAHDLSAMLTAAAIAIGISIESPMSDDALAKWIGRAIDQRGDAVIVLDNLEQIAAVAASVVSLWLDAAPGAVFLVTSRERLRIPGEHVLEVGPLGLPPEHASSVEALLDAEAVRLLLDRAARGGHRGSPLDGIAPELAREEAMALAAIVRRVEGVPLAIELCAARLGMLDPAQLLAKLSRRLDVLATDLRYAPGRQANLRGAIDWSWDLLDDRERAAFAQTSVFRGGFDLDAAEAILDLGAPAGPTAALDVLSALRDKSMITIAEGRSAGRYRLYESLREYAAEKLAASADGGRDAADRHLRHFAEAGARWAQQAKGAAFREGLAALSRESDNLLAAADRARERGDFDRAALVTICLEPLAIVRGPVLPYLDRLDRLVAEAGARLSPRVAAMALGTLGVAESRRGKPAASIARFTRAIEIAEASGDVDLLPFLLAKLANQQMVVGEDASAEGVFERARELLDAREDPAVRGVYYRHHAFFLWRKGRAAEARREGEQARALLQAHGDRRELAYVLCDLGAATLDAGELDATLEILEEALVLLRQLQYRRVESRSLLLFALARRERGRFDEAEADLRRALALPVEDGDRVAEGFALWHLACLALDRGDPREALARAREALARYEEIGDRHLRAHARMILGAALAGLGDVESASAELAIADALREGGPAHLGEALALFRALVLVAQAEALQRAAEERGPGAATPEEANRRSAGALLAEARAVLRELDDRSTSLPLANERFARRLLRKALSDADSRERAPTDAASREGAAESAPPARAARAEADLVVSDDGRWFRLSERREVTLERRAALRRILSALAKQRVTAPDTALPLEAVLEAGWPGERVSFEAGAARVYNAIQRLRKLGLSAVLRTRDDGYLLDADTTTRIA